MNIAWAKSYGDGECLGKSKFLVYLRHREAWPKLQAVAMVRVERWTGTKGSREWEA